MAFLTDRTLTTGVTTSDLIHIVNPSDLSQGNPAGSSYKATINQVFDAISGYCIPDLYVTNVHGCSPITIWDDTYFLSNQILQTNTPSTYTASTATYNGFTTIFNDNKETTHVIANFDVGNDALSGVRVFGNNTGTKGGSLLYYSPGYIFPGGVNVGVNFYQNKVALRALNDTDGMVINPNNGNPSGTLWFVLNGSATTKLKGDGNGNTTSQLGLGLNFDGTEDPTATLQVGGTGTTASFKYVDGNQSNGYVLTSDSNGNATWQSSLANSNFGSFYDTGNQTGLANTVLTMSASTSDPWNSGIILSANTRFVIQNPGVYNLQFSAQMVKTGGNSSTHTHIWLSQNGTPISYSASQVGFPSNSVYVVPAWNFFFKTINPNEYVELKWEINSNVDNQLIIKQEPASGSIPEIPSLIVTISQVR